jgi:signal transduction histidine kinase
MVITAERRDGRVELTVRDFGPGVAPEMMDKVFEPYFTTRPDGTGLGLALARQTARAHGGSLSVTGAPGGGAAFVLALPEGP